MAAGHVGRGPVSSMKTRRCGPRSGWPSNQSCLRFRTSGRFCSAAWAVFFARGRVPFEEALDRCEAEGQALLGKAAPDLLDRGVLLRPEFRHHDLPVRLDPARAPVAAQRFGPCVALLALKMAPAADAGCAHAKPLADFSMRRTGRDRRKNTNPKIDRKSLPTCPPASHPADSLNQLRFGDPLRFSQIGFRSKSRI